MAILSLLALAEPVRIPRGSKRRVSEVPVPPPQITDPLRGWEGEYAFNLVAFYDARRALVRIYSELEPK